MAPDVKFSDGDSRRAEAAGQKTRARSQKRSPQPASEIKSISRAASLQGKGSSERAGASVDLPANGACPFVAVCWNGGNLDKNNLRLAAGEPTQGSG